MVKFDESKADKQAQQLALKNVHAHPFDFKLCCFTGLGVHVALQKDKMKGSKSMFLSKNAVETLHGAHSRLARKPAIDPSSQARTSQVSTNDSPLHSAVAGDDNRCSTANQCSRLGVQTWLKRASTASWNRLLK